jgi:hypothetical protein
LNEELFPSIDSESNLNEELLLSIDSESNFFEELLHSIDSESNLLRSYFTASTQDSNLLRSYFTASTQFLWTVDSSFVSDKSNVLVEHLDGGFLECVNTSTLPSQKCGTFPILDLRFSVDYLRPYLLSVDSLTEELLASLTQFNVSW